MSFFFFFLISLSLFSPPPAPKKNGGKWMKENFFPLTWNFIKYPFDPWNEYTKGVYPTLHCTGSHSMIQRPSPASSWSRSPE